MMSDTAEKIETYERAIVRRFSTADLSEHGGWILKRLLPLYPDCNERFIAGWLSGLVSSNEHSFLYQPNAVGLAQIVSTPGLRPGKMVQERFVWVKDKADKDQLEHAADFYLSFAEWGRAQGAVRIIALEDTDVPKGLIEARLGRLFDTKVSHARL